MKKKFGKKRYFLNPKDGVAAASFSVEVGVELGSKKYEWPSIDASSSLSLSDCTRQIYLEFDIWASSTKTKTLKTIRERREKIKRLQAVVNEFADATNKSYDYIESQLDAYHKAYAKQEKKEKADKDKKKK